jgi:flagellar hook-length control protein FliK
MHGDPSASRFENLMFKSNHSTMKSADGVFDDLVRQFNFVVRKGGGEATLRLQPDSLGSMKISVKLFNGEVNTSLTVDNQAVKDLILSRMGSLEENLMSQGFQLGSFEVEVRERGTALHKETHPAAAAMEDVPDTGTPGGEEGYVPWMSTVINLTA